MSSQNYLMEHRNPNLQTKVAVPLTQPQKEDDSMTIVAKSTDFYISRDTTSSPELTFFKLKRIFLEKTLCPFCHGFLRFYGFKHRKYIDYINNKVLIYVIPRVQCKNTECLMKLKRKNKKGVTHMVMPEDCVPYFLCSSEIISDIALAVCLKQDLEDNTDKIALNLCNLRLNELKQKYESKRPGLWEWLAGEFINTLKGQRFVQLWSLAFIEYMAIWNSRQASLIKLNPDHQLSPMPYSEVASLGALLVKLTTQNVLGFSTYTIWRPQEFFAKLRESSVELLMNSKIWRNTS